MGRKKTDLKSFVKRARKIHGNKYCYALVKFKDLNDDIEIICLKHGVIKQKASNHLTGKGCKYCAIDEQKISKEEFIEKAKKIHGDKYDYSNIPDRVSAEEEIEIFCNECNSYFKSSRRKIMMADTPCSFCYSKLRGKQRTKTFEWFEKEIEKIHDNKYSLYKDKYLNTKTETVVFCKKCNKDFKIIPMHLLQGGGCQRCAIETVAKAKMLKQEDVEKEIKKACSDRYTFKPFKYDASRTVINFHCSKHDFNFQQSFATYRANGICCPKCKPKSKAELEVFDFLKENRINFRYNETMDGLKDDGTLFPDFFLPEQKIMIEVNGEHHYRPTDYSGKLSEEEMIKSFHKQKHHDWLKRKYCKRHGYRYEEIWFYENTIDKLKTILKL